MIISIQLYRCILLHIYVYKYIHVNTVTAVVKRVAFP